jgi:AcrR family transcriptional regulator
MVASTRAKLIRAARRAFAEQGYSNASMDELTAEAGLTRGALYHHFGDKKGLFEAVAGEIDAEMASKLKAISAVARTSWEAFVLENIGYLEMALDPEVQRIILRDGPAVLGDPSRWPSANSCINSIKEHLVGLQAEGVVKSDLDPDIVARLISGASTDAALLIANAADPADVSNRALPAFQALLEGLLAKP